VNVRRHILEAVTLVAAAVLCALVANSLASRERKLALTGSYPDALKVPTPAPASSATDAATTSTPGGAVTAKLPIEEERPVPARSVSRKATAPPAASETWNPSPSSSPADLVKRFPPHPDKPYVEISGDDVVWLFGRGALILDARRTNVFEDGHIAGAKSFPVWESDIDARVTALVGEARDASIPVVLYCSGGDCEDSHMLAVKLFGGGFNNLLVYRDGWPDWQKRGGRSATGPEP
jgi:rhodanese-related sulfurtransferase